ncbi:MAG TPA: sugar kinase [Chitinophagaceae bacterium]|nr:sugar kinase [Chitinophagaceae bacterium]
MTATKIVCFGEMMMRLHAPAFQRFTATRAFDILYTASEANVAVLLRLLGKNVSFITRLPGNDLGTAAIRELNAFGVDTSEILRGGDRLGLFFTEMGNENRPGRVIYDRTDSAFANLKRGEINWKRIFEEVDWFHWSGISAAVSGSAAEVCREALEAAKENGIKISVDLNYRSMLWKYGKQPVEVMPELVRYCDVMICDLDAAAICLGVQNTRHSTTLEAFEACTTDIRKAFPDLQTVAMSFRRMNERSVQEYSACLNMNASSYVSNVLQLGTIVDRIGSGDAFTGGLIFALMNGYTPEKIINFATACGAIKHSMPGDYTNTNLQEIEAFLDNQGREGKIIR